jgi:glycosyltransferase involved in cell wall biosynthesis
MKNKELSVIILTLNEEKNLEDCIKSVTKIATEIFVVDSGSSDNTTSIATKLGAKVISHEFLSHAKQFNWALDHLPIQTKWILRLDADERIGEAQALEITKAIESNNPNINGYLIRFKTIFMGRFLRHGGVYPFRKLLLFRYGKARSQDREMDEHIYLLEGEFKEIKSDGEHYDYKDLTYFVRKHNWYASKELAEYQKSKLDKSTLNNKRKFYYVLPMFVRARLFFIYRYYFRLGFLDGKEGYIFHFLQAYWYRFLVDAKLFESTRIANVNKLGKLE